MQTMHELIHQSYMSINQRSRQDRSIIGGVTVSTYGWRLLEDDVWKLEDNVRNVDVELRELVAGCMAHSVAHRPPLGILEELITSQLNQAVKAVLGAEAAAAQGLNPVASSFVPGGQPAAADPDVVRYHQKRVPQGQTEPSPLLARFYQIYFYDAWGETDDFKDYWSKPPPQSGQVPNPP
jgi:hypothetical protein